MAVTLDAGPASGAASGSNVTTFGFSGLTIGTGNCLVAVFASNITPTFTSITWGGQSLPLTPTQAISNTSIMNDVWVFMNPTPGNQTLTWTWSSAAQQCSVWAASFNNVASTVTTTATGNSATPSYSCPSASGHFAMDVLGNGAGDITSMGGAPQTQIMMWNPPIWRLDSSYILNQSTASFGWATAGGAIPFAAVMLDFTPISTLQAPVMFDPGPTITQSFRTINY